ncbi:MAG: hypothetical protein FIA98_06395 [Anaerolineae bacterium]|nr:hypothetical protein [Anaerolineae bacterium]
MSQKSFFVIICVGMLFLGIGFLIWVMTPSPVFAQCGSNPPPDSSCYTCHVQEDPVAANGEWHGVHARKDCCAKCHGGNCSTMDKDLAHQGIVANPVSDIYTNCHSCHPDDYQTRADIFANKLDIIPGSIATPTPAPSGKVLAAPLVILPSPVSTTSFALPLPLILGGSSIIILFILGIIILITRLRG